MANKRSKLEVEGMDDFMNSYREEIAQEFGVFQSTLQTEQQSSMNNVTKKIVKQKREEKR
ncbi:small, acid-soluble spore protein, alpha/beta type [Evansella tamaricis]|uniref:Small, acid-soluble spore protein, alpha/beta type n=1 Tax=Evansella tamaricis TaxID=2069301 RepID=A0ABS6JLL3_9BACI|nr:small, acid-soluble spore protein, alpha/beta type [Evansella tamaricis]MBU9714571.1 small, acid-soluble spore protein, alpha/beta type [Evansella tamaricis]